MVLQSHTHFFEGGWKAYKCTILTLNRRPYTSVQQKRFLRDSVVQRWVEGSMRGYWRLDLNDALIFGVVCRKQPRETYPPALPTQVCCQYEPSIPWPDNFCWEHFYEIVMYGLSDQCCQWMGVQLGFHLMTSFLSSEFNASAVSSFSQLNRHLTNFENS